MTIRSISHAAHRVHRTFALLLFICWFVSGAAAQPAPVGWKAGLARADITPTGSLWMGGYAARDRPAEGALHPLWAKALALEDADGSRAVIVTSDLLGLPREVAVRIAERIESEHGLTRADVMLTTSHSHSGPVIGRALEDIYPLDEEGWARVDSYTRSLEDSVVAVVSRAFASLEPAVLAAGQGVVRFAVNRRNNPANRISALTELSGPSDHAVPVLTVESSKGEVRAVLFGYACHATVLSGQLWSGDYPGFAQLALEEAYPGATALFFAGAGADQNPLPRNTVPLAQQYGRELAAAVQRVLAEEMRPLDPTLGTTYEEISLALSTPPSADELRMSAEEHDGYPGRWATRLLQNIENGHSLTNAYPYPIQTWQLGDQAIVALGGEVVVDYAIALKRLLGEQLFVVAYANDVMGYIPSTRVLREGGYEGASSQRVYGLPSTWRADVEPLIIAEVLKQIRAVGGRLPESPLD